MSGDGPESIPTSADRRSKRPVKKRALTPVSIQAEGLEALFSKPDQTIKIPVSSDLARVRNSAAPPEINNNVQGSSSGAGSGEFHVYKASRRREYARLKQLDEEAQRDKDAIEFAEAKKEREARDDEKTKRNREKREKAKARKAKGKKGGSNNGSSNGGNGDGSANDGAATAPASRPTISRPGQGDDSDDEKAEKAANEKNGTNDANSRKTTAASAQEQFSIADVPGLLIQDDDD